MNECPKFLTIRETAKTGVLPEHRLRLMEKEGALPGLRAGNKFLVNYNVLLEFLDSESRKCMEVQNEDI